MSVIYGLAAPYHSRGLGSSGRFLLKRSATGFVVPREGAPLVLNHHLQCEVSNNVKLTSNYDGVRFVAQLPDDQFAADVAWLVSNQFLTQCSCLFIADKPDQRLVAIGEVTLVTEPAYPATWCAVAKTERDCNWNSRGQACRPAAELPRCAPKRDAERLAGVLGWASPKIHPPPSDEAERLTKLAAFLVARERGHEIPKGYENYIQGLT